MSYYLWFDRSVRMAGYVVNVHIPTAWDQKFRSKYKTDCDVSARGRSPLQSRAFMLVGHFLAFFSEILKNGQKKMSKKKFWGSNPPKKWPTTIMVTKPFFHRSVWLHKIFDLSDRTIIQVATNDDKWWHKLRRLRQIFFILYLSP